MYTCPHINMKKVDIPQVLISTAAIFDIGLIWYDFHVKVFHTVRDLLNATLYDTRNKLKFVLNFCIYCYTIKRYYVQQQAC